MATSKSSAGTSRFDTDRYQTTSEWTNTNISTWIRLLLAYAGETQEQLAEGTGISSTAISRSLSRDGTRPRSWSVPDLVLLADYFDVEPGDLLSEPELPGPKPRNVTKSASRPATK